MPLDTAPRCLVLGGSGSLGAAICRTLDREGGRIAFTWHAHPERAADLGHELPEALSLQCDLRDYEDVTRIVQAAAEAMGGLDAMVCAAGVPAAAEFYQRLSSSEGEDRLQEIDQAAYDAVLEINTRGAFAACRAAAPLLAAGGGGNMVLVGAIDGIKPVPAPVHFAASQAALRGLTEALAKELGPRNIRVNLVATGILESGQARQVGEELKAAYLAHSALRRFGTVEEVAELVAFMMLDNTYVSGQTIILDGGL